MAFSRFLPLLMLLSLSSLAHAEDVTIYRCVAPGGELALRDSPCLKGETQQVRSMARPKDPVPGTAPIAAPVLPPAVAPLRQVQVIYRVPPRPMYECVTADSGERYTSDNGEGNPRSVPLWTLGYHRGGGHRPGSRGMILPVGTTWIRDDCHALPQQEVCGRLSDRRYELIRRYNSALQSERRELEVEQRGIDARIANDCGSP